MNPALLSSSAAIALAAALRIFVAGFFLWLSYKGFSGEPGTLADYERWGYASWFRLVVALGQLAGAAALLIPYTSIAGAGLLSTILLGAVLTHALHDPIATLASPLVFLVLVGMSIAPKLGAAMLATPSS